MIIHVKPIVFILHAVKNSEINYGQIEKGHCQLVSVEQKLSAVTEGFFDYF